MFGRLSSPAYNTCNADRSTGGAVALIGADLSVVGLDLILVVATVCVHRHEE